MWLQRGEPRPYKGKKTQEEGGLNPPLQRREYGKKAGDGWVAA